MQASLVSAALKFATEDPEQSGARFAELSFLFEGELNPVNPKAQRKVPLPTGMRRTHGGGQAGTGAPGSVRGMRLSRETQTASFRGHVGAQTWI